MVANKRDCPTDRSIVIVGFMASGKTTIGRRLAERLGMPFLDTDREIEKAFGCSVADIFERHGESRFRISECELILRLLGGAPRVLAAGGGAFVDEQIRREINARATSLWLDPPFELIIDRLTLSSGRPLAARRSAEELRMLWLERRRSYSQAHLHLEIAESGLEQATDRVVRALSQRKAAERG
jgi:shikimate kinase/3-dehydroquinate synthase